MIKLFVIFLLPFSGAFAGGFDQGNGGNILVCGTNLTVLDLHEGRSYFGFTYRGLEKVRGLSLEKAVPVLADSVLKGWSGRSFFVEQFEKFRREAVFVDRLPQPTSDAIVTGKLPAGCHVARGAHQYFSREGKNGHGRLLIRKKLWNRLTTDAKVALLAHEYVFRKLTFADPTCAYLRLREDVAFLLSDQAVAMSESARLAREQAIFAECGVLLDANR